jgi:hypothetical protein
MARSSRSTIRHGGEVALVDRRRLDRAVRPSDHVARANLRRHQATVFAANTPGRRITDRRPDAFEAASTRRWTVSEGGVD